MLRSKQTHDQQRWHQLQLQEQQRNHNITEMFAGADETCTALARIFHFPAHAAGAEGRAVRWSFDGDFLDWRDLPAKAPPAPYVPRYSNRPTVKGGHGHVRFDTFDAVAFLQDKGLYVKQMSAGKHEIVCPNASLHTGGDTKGTVLFQGQGTAGRMHCSHAHFVGLTLYKHFAPILGKDFMVPYCEREAEITASDFAAAFTKHKNNKGGAHAYTLSPGVGLKCSPSQLQQPTASLE